MNNAPTAMPIVGGIDAKVVFLTHFIPLYQVRVLQEMTARIDDFRILLSTPIEPNREFRPDWTGLNVDVQRTITIRQRWKHRRAGFTDSLYVHVPYDTLWRLKSLSPDVVVSHELGARSIAAARYCHRSGAKLVLATFMSEHTEQGRGWLRNTLRRRLIRQADAITYNGPSCRDYLLSLGADRQKLFYFPYAADDRNAPSTPLPPIAPELRNRLICVGQLSERKGVLQLIKQADAFCRDHDRSLEISFVGDGPLRTTIEQIARDGIDQRLQLNVLGNQPADRLAGLMRQHGGVIAPTLADEWLLVINEAMAAGMPIIGSVYAQAVTTLIQDGKNGWVYNPLHPCGGSNSRSLADVLDEYLTCDHCRIESISIQAAQTIAAYTPKRSAAGAVEAIASVIDDSTMRSRNRR